ncbi:unnamed protein product [Colias eurytheme]|nr:unnamed protein product [Colias eurytheme]
MAVFLKNFYKEANVLPQSVEYVEAVGSATPEADKAELEALGKVFCENRDDPLLVGSVMSNIGYGEAASGVSAITKISKMCPPEIEVACRNSSESSTISGPADAMKEFVESLTAKGIFAKEVPCSNIAFHSRYIADAGLYLYTCLHIERWQRPANSFFPYTMMNTAIYADILSKMHLNQTKRYIELRNIDRSFIRA